MGSNNTNISTSISCYHCGDECDSISLIKEEKHFCCNGCLTVYEILSSNDLCNYYNLEESPGIKIQAKSSKRFEYLEHEDIIESLLDFVNEEIAIVTLHLPQIHCSACLWLLENLYQLEGGIIQSRVDFLRKEIAVRYDPRLTSLRAVVELLSHLGYEPNISLANSTKKKKKSISKRLIYQIGLAGFAFGNIMLLSLPEYFGLDQDSYRLFASYFGWINLLLATPVAIYSGSDYFKSAWKSLLRKKLNIDVPIALGIAVLYLQSSYEIISQTGAGYFDSLCGLLFFLLLGRIFQEKVYHQLSFERDYRSYFPISVSRINNQEESVVPVQELKKGEQILIRNEEIIPVDAILLQGNANIDNSFVTGESHAIKKQKGDKIFAGGRQIGETILLEVIKPINQSKLTRLWSQFEKKDEQASTFSAMTDQVSQWFTPLILIIAFCAAIFHWQAGMGKVISVISAVLIVACPCALALSAPFAFGHGLRFLGRISCFAKDINALERMGKIKQIVFDKTGTITTISNQEVHYKGVHLSEKDKQAIHNLCDQNNHPLSRLIKNSLPQSKKISVNEFTEYKGKGIEGFVAGEHYRMGSAQWILGSKPVQNNSSVYLEKEGQHYGHFVIKNNYRPGLNGLLQSLKACYNLSVLSGDNDSEKEKLSKIFPAGSKLIFNQSPQQKLMHIKQLKTGGDVMMVGDGLNDAGALKEAQLGLVVTEDTNAFSPACDVILDANRLEQLPKLLKFVSNLRTIVIASFVISFLYNIVGLSFAVQGLLSPVFAAILMPLSSISVVAFVSLAVWLTAKKTLAK